MDINLVEMLSKLLLFIFLFFSLAAIYLAMMGIESACHVFRIVAITLAIFNCIGFALILLFAYKKEVVSEYEYYITADDIIYNGDNVYVRDNKTNETNKINSEDFFDNVNIIDNEKSARVEKKSYKLWFITSDGYYMYITKDMYKDIVE